MKILLSSHLRIRLKERLIPQIYIKKILSDPDSQFYDNVTGHLVAVKTLFYNEKLRPMAVIYGIIGSGLRVITIYPTTDSEINNRIKSKRWIKDETK